MARRFPLEGLLRIRRLEEDQARQRVAAANEDLAQTVRAAGGLHRYLQGADARATGAASLAAIAAARASTSSMLTVLEALERDRQETAEAARGVLHASRASVLALEKLQERHDTQVACEEGRAEQVVLDEAASAGWTRNRGTS